MKSFIPLRKPVACALLLDLLHSPAWGLAAPKLAAAVAVTVPPVNALPVPIGTSWTGVKSIAPGSSANSLVITQNQQYAIINWSSFNIGANASVYFNQKSGGVAQPTWAALNRIWDTNPSQIFGSLTADGKVYLINQNGIVFGAGSQVNVNSLAASALNITTPNFTAGLMRFTSDDFTGQGATLGSAVTVANYGSIVSDNGGFVALVAPQVVNGGTISGPIGKVSLIGVGAGPAGESTLEYIPDAVATSYDVVYNAQATPGTATNSLSGSLLSASGRVDMFGATVNQDGLASATSTVQLPGTIYLLGTSLVATGVGSLTTTPVTDSPEKVSQTFSYGGGSITLGGVFTSPDGTQGSTVNLQPLLNIVHDGAIVDPSGTVTLNATQRIYLESGSSIDVSGLWVDEAASADLVTAQLNSVQLADNYNQKNGILLGATITTTRQAGSSIGDISGSYTSQDMSAQERSTAGGQIIIGAPSLTDPSTNANYALGQFIAKQGATLNFAGGGYNYAAGNIATTKLLSGSTVYDISDAPSSLTYQAILPLTTQYVAGFQEGSNAGALSIQGRQVVLDSSVNGSVTRGVYQTATTSPLSDSGQDYAISVARGLEEPVGGTLSIGNLPGAATSTNLTTDFVTNAITVLASGNPLPASFGATDALSSQVTELSAPLLNSAGLSRLNLAANDSITIDAGAVITLASSGSYTGATGSQVYLGGLTAKARVIVDQGVIDAPGDSVELTLQDNISNFATEPNLSGVANPLYLTLTSGILLDNGSQISVAGEQVDNSHFGASTAQTVQFGHINGGTITIQDTTLEGTTLGNSVIVRSGALLDVSGGWSFSGSGALTGGNAGTLTLKGMTLSVAGELEGFAIPGSKGGSIVLQAGEVDVASTGASIPDTVSLGEAIPQNLVGRLVLGESQLASTGFTGIELDAIHDVVFESGVTLSPSTVKSVMPVSQAMAAGGESSSSAELLALGLSASDTGSPDYIGPSFVHLTAGKNIYTSSYVDGTPIYPDESAQISLPAGTGIAVAGGGGITLTTPDLVMAGSLVALGGGVSITTSDPANNLVIASGGTILAGGYLKPVTSTVMGVPVGSVPEPGGSITLTSAAGIALESGSLVDVSGSPAAKIITAGANGTPVSATVASNPGSITFDFQGGLTLQGELGGHPLLSGVQGGTLTISDSDSSLPVSASELNYILQGGFDALTLRSTVSLDFQGSMDVTLPRSLILDAPLITGTNAGSVTLSSPWVQLNNSSVDPSPAQKTSTGAETAELTLSGGYLDVNGSVQITGFSQVSLTAQQDIRLSDANYTLGIPGTFNYYGNLYTDGELTLQAARIYPTTLTGSAADPFEISAGGEVAILPAAASNSAPIYSAGGNLEIYSSGAGIDLAPGSVVAAPLGTITLNAPNGRVYLDAGSLVTTSAQASVDYGSFDGTYWYGKDFGGGSLDPLVTAAPGKSITLEGSEVVVKSGATIDFAGGGGVFSYLYQPDTEGTTDPISTVGVSALTGLTTRSNYYVILPDNSVQIPGFYYTAANGTQQLAGAVYLSGIQLANGTYLKAGVYALLPEQYAFVPGALIISPTGSTVAPGATLLTSQGYQVDGGYQTVLGTAISSPILQGYSIQSASTLLKEGNFTVEQLSAGSAGSLTINAESTFMAGTISAAALSGYSAGSLTLIGNAISVQETVAPLPDGFGFATPLPASLSGELQLSASSLSGEGLGSLTLGNLATTQTVTVQAGAVLTVPNITLAASSSVTLLGGAQVNGIGSNGSGTVTLSSPAGLIDLEANSQVHASSNVTLNVNDMDLQGGLLVDKGSLDLAASEIFFVPDLYTKTAPGLYLTPALLQSFSGYSQLGLKSSSDLNFQTNVNLTLAGTLTLDASQFTGPATVTLSAKEIDLVNSSLTPAQITQANPLKSPSGSLTLNGGTVTVSLNSATPPAGNAYGDILFNGFGTVSLVSAADLTLAGVGALKTNGSLLLSAARVTTSFYSDATTSYQAADFLIDTTLGGGVLSVTNSGGVAGTTLTPGGSLTLSSRSITVSGEIEVPSGEVTLNATGSGAGYGISMLSGGEILATGTRVATADAGTYSYFPGGEILLQSPGGTVFLAAGSTLNVAASDQGDAGSVTLLAPAGGVTLGGTLLGSAAAGKGGSFTLDSLTADLGTLAGTLASAGFTDQVSIRARTGDLTLDAGETLSAAGIAIEADGGSVIINLKGALSASDGTNGGSVTVNARNDVTLTGNITASGVVGGTVYLNSEGGMLSQTGLIDVSGTTAGGSVTFRALQNGSGVNMSLPGETTGASQIVAEAFRVYSYQGDYTIQQGDVTQWMGDAANYIAGAVMPVGWGSASGTQYHFRPGVEVQGKGDLTLGSTLDLTSYRFNGEPGVLTLRAAGDLDIDGSLVDHPTSSYATLTSATMQNSWGLNLVAGADLGAASPLGITSGPGNLTIASGSLVYTENAPVNFAAAQNVTLNPGVDAGYMITGSGANGMLYSLASYGGAVQGTVGGNLMLNGGVIQTATGSIQLSVGGDLVLQNDGAVRTTGQYAEGTMVDPGVGSAGSPASLERLARIGDYWSYEDGGSIALNVAGSVDGFVNNLSSQGSGLANAWDWYYGGGTILKPQNQHLSASFQGVDSTAGIATMGGGDITVRSGGAFTSQIGTFGTQSTGNLEIVSGGDLNGRFRIMNGTGTLLSGGSFGSARLPQVIEMANAQVSVAAQGSVYLGTVLNPDNTRYGLFPNSSDGLWNLTYSYAGETATSVNSGVSITSLTGNLTYLGQSTFDGYPTSSIGSVDYGNNQRILPPDLSLIAAGNIDLENDLYLAPSPTGNLKIVAGGTLDGTKLASSGTAFSEVFMTDQDPSTVYGYQPGETAPDILEDTLLNKTLVHAGDGSPVVISAGGNIQDLQLVLTKEAQVSAGQDILQLVYSGENLSPTDVSRISAGNDIDYVYNVGFYPTLPAGQDYGIQQGGVGTLVVQAGGNIDLGNSAGIQSVSNYYSPLLTSTGCNLVIAVGASNGALQSATVSNFFSSLQKAGISYSDDLASGDTAAAQAVVGAVQSSTIAPLFAAPPKDGSGSLSMTQSQICTLGANSSISILTQGDLNVGKTALSSGQNLTETGIYTASGGGINIYSGDNVNVNESRVMTFLGGDITVWSDLGDINAGRGSRTTVAASSPHFNPVTLVTTFTPPAVGSGIRALTYDPNEVPGGPLPIPSPGNIYMFAPTGVIDAGEAGIAGGKVVLGATQVLNAQNISFSSGSVGVPSTSGSGISLGALAGAGSVSDSSKMIEQTATQGTANGRAAQQAAVVDDFMSRWLDLRIISFDDDAAASDGDTQPDKDKKKKK